MSKFNTTSVPTTSKTNNLAGGEAYSTSPELEFVSLLLTSFVNDQFYRTAGESLAALKIGLAKLTDKEFAAKAAIYARDEFGMRSITHALAAELAPVISGKPWAKSFYDKIVSRVDDMSEIMSYYITNKTGSSGGKVKFPNSMKK